MCYPCLQCMINIPKYNKNIKHNKKLKVATDCCVHDSCPMGSDGVCYMSNVDSVQVFVVAGSFHKYLQNKKENVN